MRLPDGNRISGILAILRDELGVDLGIKFTGRIVGHVEKVHLRLRVAALGVLDSQKSDGTNDERQGECVDPFCLCSRAHERSSKSADRITVSGALSPLLVPNKDLQESPGA
jgi:hypothetical protein